MPQVPNWLRLNPLPGGHAQVATSSVFVLASHNRLAEVAIYGTYEFIYVSLARPKLARWDYPSDALPHTHTGHNVLIS